MPRPSVCLLLPMLCLMPATLPAIGQSYEPPPAETQDGNSLSDGIEGFMENLLNRAQPSLDQLGQDLGGLADRIGPVLGDIGKMMDDVRNYQAPERLANGDIVIRRKPDAPPPPPVGPSLQDMLRPSPDTPPPAGLHRDPENEIDL